MRPYETSSLQTCMIGEASFTSPFSVQRAPDVQPRASMRASRITSGT